MNARGMAAWSIAVVAFADGCAGAAAVRPDANLPGTRAESSMARLTQTSEDQGRRLAELETRLALLEKEAHEWREQATSKPPETVRIGPRRRAPEPAFESDGDTTVDRTPVQTVRLYEAERPPAEAPPLPAPPLGVSNRLPVVPLPDARAGRAVSETPIDAEQREAYRVALRMVRERRWVDALQALDKFLARYRDGALVASATYWQGEVHYAQRQYGEALQQFQAVLSRFPESDKVADSLLKVGMCHLRLGDQAMAQRYFRQVREQYPSSDAARIASREGAS
jgi:tol-pal system protein YbgF